MRSRQKRLQLQQQKKLLTKYRYFQQQRESELSGGSGRSILGPSLANELNTDEHGNIMVLPPPIPGDATSSGVDRRRWATRRGWEDRGHVEPPLPLTFWGRMWVSVQFAVSWVFMVVASVLLAVGAAIALCLVLYTMIVHRKWQREQELEETEAETAVGGEAEDVGGAWATAQRTYYYALDEYAVEYLVKSLLPKLLPNALMISLFELLLPGYVRESETTGVADGYFSNTAATAAPQIEGVLEISHTLQMFTTSSDIIGYGSHGTVVYRGLYRNRYPVAIKRMLGHYQAFASREINTLIELSSDDGHPNIVKYFDTSVTVGIGDSSVIASDSDGQGEGFVYLALQLCHLSLKDFISNVQLSRKERFRQQLAQEGASEEVAAQAAVYMVMNPAVKAALMQMADGINQQIQYYSPRYQAGQHLVAA